jgi:hypothetical protein
MGRLLNPTGNQNEVKRYVQEQAITTLAMVADASETVFAKVILLFHWTERMTYWFPSLALLDYHAPSSQRPT